MDENEAIAQDAQTSSLSQVLINEIICSEFEFLYPFLLTIKRIKLKKKSYI